MHHRAVRHHLLPRAQLGDVDVDVEDVSGHHRQKACRGRGGGGASKQKAPANASQREVVSLIISKSNRTLMVDPERTSGTAHF